MNESVVYNIRTAKAKPGRLISPNAFLFVTFVYDIWSDYVAYDVRRGDKLST